MQHVTIADKSLLIGDAATDLLLQYAALLGRIQSADMVKVNAISGDGDEVVAGFLLNSGSVFVIETSRSSTPEPENAEAEEYMRDRLESYSLNSAAPFGLGDGQMNSPS